MGTEDCPVGYICFYPEPNLTGQPEVVTPSPFCQNLTISARSVRNNSNVIVTVYATPGCADNGQQIGSNTSIDLDPPSQAYRSNEPP